MIETIKKIARDYIISRDTIETQNGIRMKVRGSDDIEFINGGQTRDMKESGVSINAQEHLGILVGGCINREETKYLRDFLSECIEQWEQENE